MDIPEIPFLENCLSYTLINEGFSTDVKWCIDERYLLCISPTIPAPGYKWRTINLLNIQI